MTARYLLRFGTIGYLLMVLLIPVGLVFYRAFQHGLGPAWDAVTTPGAVHAFWLTILIAAIAVPANTLFGVALAIALVRHRFPGHGLVNALVDLPLALSPVVVGLALALLYGTGGWLGGLATHGVKILFAVPGMVLATIFVSLPFVVRAVQPVLLELDREMEEAAASLGAKPTAIFRRIVFPNLLPAILAGVALAFARSVGEYGSVVLISGNLPFKTEVSSVYIFSHIESSDTTGAAAVSVVLLAISLAVLLAIGAFRRWRDEA